MREKVNDFLWKSLTIDARAGQRFPPEIPDKL